MRRAVVLQHIDREGPGRLSGIVAEHGLAVEVRRLDQWLPVPERVVPGDILVILGGPMGVADVGNPRYPFLAAEVALLQRAVREGWPVLGICLGAQLLAHAAGAAVYSCQALPGGPAPEVGFAPVRYAGVGRQPLLAGLGESELVLHWHGDTFDLPEGAVRLAATERCPNQAFRIGAHVVGLQFHVEVDAPTVCQWAVADSAFVTAALGADGPARIVAAADAAAGQMRGPGDRLLRNIVGSLVTAAASRIRS